MTYDSSDILKTRSMSELMCYEGVSEVVDGGILDPYLSKTSIDNLADIADEHRLTSACDEDVFTGEVRADFEVVFECGLRGFVEGDLT